MVDIQPEDRIGVEDLVRVVFDRLGLDTDDPRLRDSPRRYLDTMRELLAGVNRDAGAPLRNGEPTPAGTHEICLSRIGFRSLCAHHMLAFAGHASVVYEPGGHLLGLGAIAQSLEILSTRPQLQENLGQELASILIDAGGAQGALVVIRARHGCIADRGPRQNLTMLTTVCAQGSLAGEERRAAALALVRQES